MEADSMSRKCKRGLSVSQGNEALVSQARDNMLDKIEVRDKAPYFKEPLNTTFMLPNLSDYPCRYRAFLEKDLIEQSTLLHLETESRLNWWCDNDCMQKLWPLSTTGDGNCLLHAASLAMWGFHDRHLTLRHALHHRLIKDNQAFFQRWAYSSKIDHQTQGFEMSVEEMEKEWQDICNLSLPVPRGGRNNLSGVRINSENSDKYLICCNESENENSDSLPVSAPPASSPYKKPIFKPQKSSPPFTMKPISSSSRNKLYDFLEQIHIFVLANILRRPIIVLCDNFVRDIDGNPMQPLAFGGLYLPLLEKPDNCEKSPLLLAYYNSHFSALVPMQYDDKCTKHKNLPLAIPLIDADLDKTFSIHFAMDPGPDWVEEMDLNKVSKCKVDEYALLQMYLSCKEFQYCPDHKRSEAIARVRNSSDPASSQDTTGDYQKHSLTRKLGRQIKDTFSHKSKSKSHNNIKSEVPSASSASSASVNMINTSGKRIRRNSQFWDKVKDGSTILGANLQVRTPTNYSEMIQNYLNTAEKDYQELESKSEKTNVEIVEKLSPLKDGCIEGVSPSSGKRISGGGSESIME